MQFQTIRPKTVTLIAKLTKPLVDEGVIGVEESKEIIANLRHLAKEGTALPPVEPKLIDQRQVAEMLGIGLSNFKRQEAELGIARRMVGSSVRYRNLDVLKFIMASADAETAPPR